MTTSIPRRRFLASCAAGVFLARPNAHAAEEPRDSRRTLSAGESQLFVDDHLIASTSGLERVVHRPAKQGLIQEADGTPWQRGDAPSIVRDQDGQFHLYYRFLWEDPSVRDLHPGIGNDKAHWFGRTVGYAVSDDGIRWSKPILRMFDGPTGFLPRRKRNGKTGCSKSRRVFLSRTIWVVRSTTFRTWRCSAA